MNFLPPGWQERARDDFRRAMREREVDVRGIRVAIHSLLPPGWFGTCDGVLMAASVEAADKVLSRIVWTSPPCVMLDDGRLLEIQTEKGGR